MNILAIKNGNEVLWNYVKEPSKPDEFMDILIKYYRQSEKVYNLMMLGAIDRIGMPNSERGGIDERYTTVLRRGEDYMSAESMEEILERNKAKFDYAYYWNGEYWQVFINGPMFITMDIARLRRCECESRPR